MESIVGVMQKVAQQEASKIYTTELGIVTALFPHTSEDDKENYQCSIKLKNKKLPDGKDFELRQVPLITPHIGLVNIPNIGDLVLVTFIGGNINAPVIIGRLYNDEDIPPVNKPKEFLLQHNQKEGGKVKIDAEGVVTLTSKNEKNEITIDDEKITAANEKCQVSLAGGSVTIDNGSCKLTIESGGITIDAASSNVTVKSMGTIKIGDATTGSVQLGGRMPGNAVADNDQIILSTHTHVGNLGAPCPIMVPMEKINSIQAKARNTKVG